MSHDAIRGRVDVPARGLFTGGEAAMWRADLLPAILRWIDQVPECDWRLFVGFGATSRGGFEANFLVPDRSGTLRDVTIRFDRHMYQCLNDACGLELPRILDFHSSHLYGTANLAVSATG
jgi:hypothetical protein